jgi:plasmid stabilization system protein ParE
MQGKPFPLCGGSILDKYDVKIYARAYRDLEGIYTYIAENLLEPGTALNMVDELEKAIFSLEYLPERGAVRRVGAYANGDYRQLFVKKYCIIYRVLKEEKEVHIVTVRYAPSNY